MQLDYKEYITKENLTEFLMRDVDEIKEKEDYIYVKFYGQGMGPSPEFHVTDFSFKGINSYHSFDLSKEWLTFMIRILNPSLRIEYADKYNKYIDSLKISTDNINID